MTPSWRKPAGAFAIIALIVGWCVLIASFSAAIGSWPILVQLVFYVFHRHRLDHAAQAIAVVDGDRPLARAALMR